MQTARRWMVGAVAAVACADPAIPQDEVLRLLTPAAWSAGEILLGGRWPSPRDPLPVVQLGDSALALRRTDDTTVAARLPDLHAGVYPLRATWRGAAVGLDPVRVYGFREEFTGPDLSGLILPWPGGANPTFLANGDGTLVFVDLRFRTTWSFPDSIHFPACLRRPGLAYTGAVILSSGLRCDLRTWQISPSLQAQAVETGPINLWTNRAIAQLDSATWLYAGHHFISVQTAPGTWYHTDPIEETNGFHFSLRAGRASTYGGYTREGVPLFDNRTGEIVARVRGIALSEGLAYTPGGDTLYMVGQVPLPPPVPGDAPTVLLALDAASGAVLDSLVVGTGAWDLALDEANGWLYVLAGPFPVELRVYERAPLRHVATLRPTGGECNRGQLILSPLEHTVYTVGGFGLDPPARASHICRFDVMPRLAWPDRDEHAGGAGTGIRRVAGRDVHQAPVKRDQAPTDHLVEIRKDRPDRFLGLYHLDDHRLGRWVPPSADSARVGRVGTQSDAN